MEADLAEPLVVLSLALVHCSRPFVLPFATRRVTKSLSSLAPAPTGGSSADETSPVRATRAAGGAHLGAAGAVRRLQGALGLSADGDFGRIKRQQEFMRAVMAKVGRPTVLGNPLRVNRRSVVT